MPPASPFSAIELDAHLLRVRWVGVECLAIGAAIVSLPFVVFVVPSLVTAADFLRPDLGCPPGRLAAVGVALRRADALGLCQGRAADYLGNRPRAGRRRAHPRRDGRPSVPSEPKARGAYLETVSPAMAATEALAKIDGAR